MIHHHNVIPAKTGIQPVGHNPSWVLTSVPGHSESLSTCEEMNLISIDFLITRKMRKCATRKFNAKTKGCDDLSSQCHSREGGNPESMSQSLLGFDRTIAINNDAQRKIRNVETYE
jgi:hypothetical protein